jgi:hypothetical protein
VLFRSTHEASRSCLSLPDKVMPMAALLRFPNPEGARREDGEPRLGRALPDAALSIVRFGNRRAQMVS